MHMIAGLSLLLLALAAGYGVLVLAAGQSKPLDGIGRVVGGIIVLVSLGTLVLGAICGAKCSMGKYKGMCGDKAMACHPGMGDAAEKSAK